MRKILFATLFLLISGEYALNWSAVHNLTTKPFVYRQFIPTLASISPLGWIETVIIVQALLCVALGLAMLYVYEKNWKVTRWNDFILLASFAVVILAVSSHEWKKTYDIPTALFFLLLYITWVEEKYKLALALFAVACLNRETAILIVPVLFFIRRKPLLIWFVVSWVAIRFVTVYALSDSVGQDIYINLAINIAMYLKSLLSTIVLAASGLFITLLFLSKVAKIERGMMIFVSILFPILTVLYMVAGWAFEVRVFAEVLPLLLMSTFMRVE